MPHTEKERSCQELYHGRIFTLTQHQVELENGQPATRDVINHHGGSCVAALDGEGRLLMVRQYRFPTGGELLELPAGKLEAGEDPKAAAFRELEEETGYATDTLEELTTLWPTPAYCTEVIHIYAAGRLTPSVQHLDRDEFLDVVAVPFREAVEQVLRGEITDAKTQVAILLLEARRTRGLE